MSRASRIIRRDALLAKLRELEVGKYDQETDHQVADRLLLEFIADPEITEVFEAIPKWYA